MSDLCTIAVSQDSMEPEFQPETIAESMLLLLKSKQYSDVTFTFPNLPDGIQAHEFCLKARSPVFAKMFRMRKSGNVEGNEIEISECTPERFQQFLEFIYSDKFEVDIAGALDLLQLSKKYEVHPLTKKCEEILKTGIPIPQMDAVSVFETARRHGLQELMNPAGQLMVNSFLELIRADALDNAEEETLAYLLESDHLDAKEVGLFQFIVEWGRKQVGSSADDELLRDKLRNLLPKIRYTNMAPDEFTTVVVPTRLMSAEETISVYSYFCGNEVSRRDFKTEFNTTPRKAKYRGKLTKLVSLTDGQMTSKGWDRAFSKHCLSFHADRTQVDTKVRPDYLLKKTLITENHFRWPRVTTGYSLNHVLRFNISIGEYSGPVKEEKLTIRFQDLLYCPQGCVHKVSVYPPVELISGRKYSVIVEDHSTSDSIHRFRSDPNAYTRNRYPNTKLEASADFEDASLNFKELHSKTDYYGLHFSGVPDEMVLIEYIQVGLV